MMKRYMRWAGLYLIAFPFGFHERLSEYPAILNHLSQFKGELKKHGNAHLRGVEKARGSIIGWS